MSLMTLTRPALAIAIAATLTLAGAAQAGTMLPAVGSGTLKLHLSADTGITVTGGNVSQWNDQSAENNHFTQSDTGKQPTVASGAFNGNDAIRFDGTDDFLTSMTALALTEHAGLEKNYTLFISAKGANADGLLATGENRGSPNHARTGLFNETGTSNPNDFENAGTSGDGVGITTSLLGNSGSGIEGAALAIRYDRPLNTLSGPRMDLKQKVLGTTTENTVTGKGARDSFFGPEEWHQAWGGATSIGGAGTDPSNPSTFFDGDVFEVVLYEGTLSNKDRDAVLAAMATTAEIPEPATLALLGLGGAVMLSGRKRRSA